MKVTMNPKLQIVEEAVQTFDEIVQACTRPDKAISGKTLDIYNELADWGFIDKYKVTDTDNKWLYVVLIAMHLSKSASSITFSDSYVKQDQRGKWQIIQSALERASKEKEKLESEEKEDKKKKKKE